MNRKTRILALIMLCMALCSCGGTKTNTDDNKAGGTASGFGDVYITSNGHKEKPEADTFVEETEEEEIPAPVGARKPDLHPFDFTVDFAGDINFADDHCTIGAMHRAENGIYDCISPELIQEMNEADLMCLNNEFTYSTRGEPLPGKLYTFRANPQKVELMHVLGVDIVKLANNHVYDYGRDAMLDTFTTLEDAGIDYMGAGVNLERAMEPVYKEVDGRIIAFVAASRAEKHKMTPQATETDPGILRCYDNELFLDVIREARDKADIVLAYIHWGTEYSTVLEDVQKETAREYIDAGADVIIGAHSHCLQGMEFYEGRPIFYSLGNFWFNSKTLDTMLLQLHFTGNDETYQVVPKIFPAVQADSMTKIAETPEERERIFDFLESISIGVEIDEEGIVHEIENSVE